MRSRQFFIIAFIFMVSYSLFCREIVVGIEPRPVRKIAVIFTPLVLFDLFSVKAAFEYRIHKKFSLVVPLEAKWMNYRKAIERVAEFFEIPREDILEAWYDPSQTVRPVWNFDFSQFKISTGIGAKWFPFNEAMVSSFFVKSLLLVGVEKFYTFNPEGHKDSAVFTPVLTIGYHWFKPGGFNLGLEAGAEYTLHTSPMKGLPVFVKGFMPLLQFSLGFTI